MAMVHCRECGKKISDTASSCPKCGAHQKDGARKKVNWNTAIILAIFLGWIGADRFYMGHIGLGIIKLLTFGGYGIWWLIDIILIATKKISSVDWEQN
ncbi:MAG: TM2 domain-containing protein [Nanoarchaeota archaeon]|nr:TM2 domain-containing protein [Nanoarchaeota archaeon]MCG2719610.1 TM2 domain-containing protein [Nanoarchaeota archaeon]